MLIIEIALGIVLAVLILSYLPEILGFSIGITALLIFLGVVAGVIALLANFPQLGIVILIAICIGVLGIIGKSLENYVRNNYEKFPSWLKWCLASQANINWMLLLFSCFLGFIACLVILGGIILALDSLKLLDKYSGLALAPWLVLLPVATVLIYRLLSKLKARAGHNS